VIGSLTVDVKADDGCRTVMSRGWWNRWKHRSVKMSRCMLRSMTRNSARIFPALWRPYGTCWSTPALTSNMTRWILLHL